VGTMSGVILGAVIGFRFAIMGIKNLVENGTIIWNKKE
jgi:hypothetical protein